MASIYDFSAKTIDGDEQPLAAYRGNAMLVVNVASKCGFTPQYAGLEALYRRYRDAGLVVLGFPCDQFGHQEPGDEAEIRKFRSLSASMCLAQALVISYVFAASGSAAAKPASTRRAKK